MGAKRKRAVLCDGSPASCASLAQLLRSEGLEVVACGEVAAVPDAALADAQLLVLVLEAAGMARGARDVEQLRRRVGARARLVVVLGNDAGPAVEALASAGADEFVARELAEPLLRQHLRAMLRDLHEAEKLRRRIDELEGFAPGRPRAARTPGSTADDPLDVEVDDFAEGLSRAVADEALDVSYQPKVAAHDGKPTGAEALLRWNDPALGAVSPARFVPALERLGLIEVVGSWTLDRVCAQRASWARAGLPAGKVAVNVSPLQLRSPDLAEHIVGCAAAHGLDPACLQIEITEGSLIEDPDEVAATLRALREHGIGICIDDFGTGFSSLQYLARLPIDCLKIDRAFVEPLENDPEARSLVIAIIGMAWNLGLRVVAEGVETRAQWDFLTDHGCDEIQGFFVSRSLGPQAFVEWLRRRVAG